MQSITRQSNDTDTLIGSASGGNTEKAGWKAGSVQSLEKRQFYETKEKKHPFIRERFQLDTKAILTADAKLKEVVIQLF